MVSSQEEIGNRLDPRSHTAFKFFWTMPHEEIPMLPLRMARRHARIESSTATGRAACELNSRDLTVLPSSNRGSLPQDVLLIVFSHDQLHGCHVVPGTPTCRQWLGVLNDFVYQAKPSQLTLPTPATDAARRKLRRLFPSASKEILSKSQHDMT